ncbi:hypothetical protein TNCV_1064001 [Trichonephila clavipes]|nr:hypothetical protein TNCV_1064001 [Trichonephila clavipes]
MKNHSHASRIPSPNQSPSCHCRMINSTFAMPNIIDSHDMGLRTAPDAQKLHNLRSPGKCEKKKRKNRIGKSIEEVSSVRVPTGLALETNNTNEQLQIGRGKYLQGFQEKEGFGKVEILKKALGQGLK